MRLERQKIYREKGGSYRLILGETKFGGTFAYLTDVKAYDNITGTKIDDIGYVCIDRILYIPWNKFHDRGYTEYRRLSNKEYSAIVHAISQFMLGDISFVNNTFMYKDEIDSLVETKPEEKETSPTSAEEVETVTVESATTTIVTNTLKKSTTEKQSIPINITFDTTTFNPPANNIVEEAKKHNIPVAEEVNETKEKFYDLFSAESNPIRYNTSSNNSNRSNSNQNDRRSNAGVKHVFSEDEALAISVMNTNAVMAKYKVRANIATLMIRNAKRIFGFEVKNIDSTRKFASLFKMGYTVEQVSEMTGVALNKVKYYYERSTFSYDNNTSVEQKWNDIISANNTDLIVNVVCNMSVAEFCKMEKCRMPVGYDVVHKLIDFLSMNPLFCAGFDKMAFDQDSLNEFISTARNSKTKSNMATVFIYEKVMDLYDAYVKSFNHHADILAGVREIPDYVPVEDHEYFLTLIYNRFNPNNITGKDRILNKMQKEVIRNNGSNADFAKAFMVNPKKATAVKTKYRSNN